MIVRIAGEGQWMVPRATVAALNAIDHQLEQDLRTGDESSFVEHLETMHRLVREEGTPLPDEALLPSSAVLPYPGCTLPELRALMSSEGLVPG